jgi:hypothetical protein
VGALATGRPDDLTTVVTEATIDGGGVARAASVVDGGDWLTRLASNFLDPIGVDGLDQRPLHLI